MMAKDAILSVRDLLDAQWNLSPKPSIEDISVMDRGEGKRTRLQDRGRYPYL